MTPIIREIKILVSVHGSNPKKHPHDPTRILLALNSALAQKREGEREKQGRLPKSRVKGVLRVMKKMRVMKKDASGKKDASDEKRCE